MARIQSSVITRPQEQETHRLILPAFCQHALRPQSLHETRRVARGISWHGQDAEGPRPGNQQSAGGAALRGA